MGETVRGQALLRRLVPEAIAIVASILLAFAIDAAWERRGLLEDEHLVMESLDRDLATAATLLEAVAAVHRRVEASASQIIEMTNTPLALGAEPSLTELLPVVLGIPVFTPPSGALDALIASGDLGLIRDQSLRESLASFPSHVAELNRTEFAGSDQVYDVLLPYLNRRVPLNVLGLSGPEALWEPGPAGPLDQRTTAMVAAVLSDLEFANILQNRVMLTRFALFKVAPLVTEIEGMRAQIHQALGRTH